MNSRRNGPPGPPGPGGKGGSSQPQRRPPGPPQPGPPLRSPRSPPYLPAPRPGRGPQSGPSGRGDGPQPSSRIPRLCSSRMTRHLFRCSCFVFDSSTIYRCCSLDKCEQKSELLTILLTVHSRWTWSSGWDWAGHRAHLAVIRREKVLAPPAPGLAPGLVYRRGKIFGPCGTQARIYRPCGTQGRTRLGLPDPGSYPLGLAAPGVIWAGGPGGRTRGGRSSPRGRCRCRRRASRRRPRRRCS
jgi:hypothetical protein